VARVGFLANAAVPTVFSEGFRRGLAELGYVEGENIEVEWRFADVSDERLAQFANELVGLDVDVLVGSGTQACLALQKATATVPIVMGNSSDPVGVGLVQSLARPGGNITGVSAIGPRLAQKRLAILHDLHPRMKRVAIVWNPADPPRGTEYREIEAAARQLQLDLLSLQVSNESDLRDAIRQASSWPTDAIVVLEDPLTHSNIATLVSMIVQAGRPSAHSSKPYAEAGGLVSYGANLAEVYRRSAVYVDKILKGARPADLPVEQANEFDFVVNLRTARALGLTVPQSVVVQATEIIQ
jgi:putative ABC transport system substrate-binding protein